MTVRTLLAWLVILCACEPNVRAQTTTQTILLQPGWNSVWLELEPVNTLCSAVFNGVPIASVWTYRERLPAIDFIQDASEARWNKNNMLLFVPTNQPQRFLTSLFHIEPNRPYLVKLTGGSPASLTVTGRPSLRSRPWTPDSFSLRGLPVNPAAPPTFVSFFGASGAHSLGASQIRPIYRLNGAGQWVQALAGDSIQAGVAYWIFTKGASDYQGPLTAATSLDDALAFGPAVRQTEIELENHTSTAGQFTIADLGAPAPNPLSYADQSPSNLSPWLPLPSPLSIGVGPRSNLTLRVSVRRQDMTSSAYSTVLSIIGNTGTRFLVPVSVQNDLGSITGATPSDQARRNAGLWVGVATINAISEAHGGVLQTNDFTYPDGSVRPRVERVGAGVIPTPTHRDFNLRLIVHVDTNGTARLLKEVIQMWKDGNYTNDPATNLKTVDKPGQYVLVSNPEVIPHFKGATIVHGKEVGRRFSTAGFDFPKTGTNNFLPLTGFFAAANTLSGAIVLAPDFPTNPFKHRYHPDHDNFAPDFRSFRLEAFEVQRALQFVFDGPPDTAKRPDSGYDLVTGTYKETMSGLHRSDIAVQGTFRLERVSKIGVLNQ